YPWFVRHIDDDEFTMAGPAVCVFDLDGDNHWLGGREVHEVTTQQGVVFVTILDRRSGPSRSRSRVPGRLPLRRLSDGDCLSVRDVPIDNFAGRALGVALSEEPLVVGRERPVHLFA